MQPTCPQCSSPIHVIPGHRQRRYCSDQCKQTAYRRRHGKQARPTKREKEMVEKLTKLGKIQERWPHFGFGTQRLLQEIQQKHGTILMEKVAERIQWERNQAASNRNTP